MSTNHRSLLLATAAAIALSGAAMANGRGVPQAVPPPPVPAAPEAAPAPTAKKVSFWQGAYWGANAGYSWSHSPVSTVFGGNYFLLSSTTDINANAPTRFSEGNFTGGLQVGYLWAFTNGAAGFEADVNWAGLDESQTVNRVYPCCGPSTYTLTSRLERDWLATFRGRIGFTASDDFFIYATGGAAVGDVAHSITFADNFAPIAATTFTRDETKFGWTAGGGADVKVTGAAFVRLEYLYVDLGKVNVTGSGPALGGTWNFTSEVNARSHIGRAAVNFKF